jgi:cyclophilin family peptidyl-prolyl cis-trans isomerase
MKLTFPKTMNDYEKAGPDGRIIIEMAPIELVPYCVYYFLELVTHFKGGSFHRFAGHVLQAMASGDNTMGGGGGKGLAFQEYHPDNPHKLLTLGYAGRPGGPAFYISTIDNTRNHGPASQNSKTEADGCFGRIYSGEEVVNRMKKQPGTTKPSGFVNNKENFIKIESLKLISNKEL